MIFKPLKGDLTSLTEMIDSFHSAVNVAFQTEFPGMALRTSMELGRRLEKAAQALADARRVADNAWSAVSRGEER